MLHQTMRLFNLIKKTAVATASVLIIGGTSLHASPIGDVRESTGKLFAFVRQLLAMRVIIATKRTKRGTHRQRQRQSKDRRTQAQAMVLETLLIASVRLDCKCQDFTT